jgi:CRP/FNR family cyclic AMP-dependent transcriptional regulator
MRAAYQVSVQAPRSAGRQGHTKKPVRPAEASALSDTELFRDIPEKVLLTLEKNTEVRELPSGHSLFHPGESGNALYVLETGSVQTYRTSGARKLIISDLKPFAIFGEVGCVGPCIYHCSAQTTAPSRIRSIARRDLDRLMHEFPVITRRLLDLVSDRFVNVLLELDSTSFRNLIPRLAQLLLKREESERVQNMTHREFAEQLRVHRESVTSALGELREAGIIAIGRKEIRILDRGRLERAARE